MNSPSNIIYGFNRQGIAGGVVWIRKNGKGCIVLIYGLNECIYIKRIILLQRDNNILRPGCSCIDFIHRKGRSRVNDLMRGITTKGIEYLFNDLTGSISKDNVFFPPSVGASYLFT